MTNLLMKAYDYVDIIINDIRFTKLNELNETIKNKYNNLIDEYIKAKEEYEEVMEYSTYHPDFKTKANAFSKIRGELFKKEELVLQSNLYKELELEINKFLNEIASTISENIPTLNELGFVSRKGGIGCQLIG